jgi:hypothetical protein
MFSRDFEEIHALPEAELREVGFTEDEADALQASDFFTGVRELIAKHSGKKPRCLLVIWVDEADLMGHAAMMTRAGYMEGDRTKMQNEDASILFHIGTVALPTVCSHHRPDEDDDDWDGDDEPVVDPDPGSPDMAQS